MPCCTLINIQKGHVIPGPSMVKEQKAQTAVRRSRLTRPPLEAVPHSSLLNTRSKIFVNEKDAIVISSTERSTSRDFLGIIEYKRGKYPYNKIIGLKLNEFSLYKRRLGRFNYPGESGVMRFTFSELLDSDLVDSSTVRPKFLTLLRGRVSVALTFQRLIELCLSSLEPIGAQRIRSLHSAYSLRIYPIVLDLLGVKAANVAMS